MFPNLSERHCIISRDSLCSHATVIQSELVEIHMHAFQKEEGWGSGDGRGRGGRRTESRQLHLARENSCHLSARECKTSSALNQQ